MFSSGIYHLYLKINLEGYRMELWPGYQTSIRQHENDILLCAEIAHKVMRTDTLYNILSEAIRDNDDYQTAFRREVVGENSLSFFLH